MADSTPKAPFSDEYSSRIKKIMIQLHDYHFYHGPYKEIFGDERFIGRKSILTKLKSLFTRSEYKSGVYLITGYRGSGKTSLVNKAIDEINNRVKLLKGSKIAYCLILLFYIFFSFFFIKFAGNFFGPLTGFISGILVFAVVLWYYTSYIWKEKNQYPWGHYCFFTDLLRSHCAIKDLKHHERKNVTSYFPWMILTVTPILVVSFRLLIFYKLDRTTDFICILQWLSVSFYVIVLLNAIYNFADFFKRNRNEAPWRKLIYGLFKFNTNIFIKLNLGQRKLREIDILRLLARNLKTEYSRYYRHRTFSQILVTLGLFYVIYILSYLIYYQDNMYDAHNLLKAKSGMTEFFPSQAYNLLDTINSRDHQKILYSHISDHYQNYLGRQEQKPGINIQHKTVVEYIWEKVSFAFSYGVILADSYLYIAYDHARHFLVDGFLLGFPNCLDARINNNKVSYGVPFSFIPYHLDYFFLLYVFFLYIIIKKAFINGLFLSARPKKIKKRIDELNDIIVSEVTVDKLSLSPESSPFNFFTFFSPKTKRRTLADVKEIEKTLIDVLEEIDRIRFPYSRPDIIVVFDELDKIETHTYLYERPAEERREAEPGAGMPNKNPNPSFTIDGTRERQQTLQLLLSNLKYFLSDAKAKFIFIAGREMYDASLADISDRNYFMGSIFHEVINVNSFLSDNTDKRPSDITSMIERYVCQFLIHPDYVDYYKKQEILQRATKKEKKLIRDKEKWEYSTLAVLNSYLIKSFPELLDESPDSLDETGNLKNVAAQIIARQKREKILNLIQRFIIYLTHASNGAPKKVTNYFENFVQFRTLEEDKYAISHFIPLTLKDKERIKKREHAYLVFNYNKQYELGLINYITLPIILTISNHIKNFGDKLLVSATFLCDHLLKFHKDGFSWRNIEYIPEILEINRTPELRAFINNILDLLLQTHLQTILSGLYSFRFNQRLSNEISFLSKVSEEASASFNFTLDESLAIKHYYHSLLYRLEERYRKITTDRKEYIHSIAMVHAVLGDLYFYDEEYNDAILEYMDSIQYLRYSGFSDENFSLLLILVRNMLKLGLSFEKRKSYSSAFEIYKELCYLLIKRRDIDLKELGLEEKSKGDHLVLSSPDVSHYHEKKDVLQESIARETYKEEYALKNRFRESFPLDPNNKIKEFLKDFEQDLPIAHKDNFINKLTEQLNPVVEKILGKIATFEGVRLIYQPLLARLQIMEKCIMGGITKIDVFRIEREFDYLQKAINQKEKIFLKIEFYNKVGDILFFKRGNIKSKTEEKEYPCPCWAKETVNKDFIFYVEPDQETAVEHEKTRINDPKMKCAACLFYKKSIELFARHHEQMRPDDEADKPLNLKDSLNRILHKYPTFSGSSYTSVKILAEMISDLADSTLGCMKLEVSRVDLVKFNDFLSDPKPVVNTDSGTIVPREGVIEDIVSFSPTGILRMFYLSALFYKKAGDYREYVWQLTKVLYLIKEIFQYLGSPGGKKNLPIKEDQATLFISNCQEKIVQRAIRGCWSAYENAHMNEVSRNKEIINDRSSDPEKKNKKPTTLKRISVNNDIEEITMLFNEIQLLVDNLSLKESTDPPSDNNVEFRGIYIDHYLKNLVSPYGDADSVYNRIVRLNYKAKLNYHMFDNVIIIGKLKKNLKNDDLDLLNLKLNQQRKSPQLTSHWYKEFLKIIVKNADLFDSKIILSSGENNRIQRELTMRQLFCHLIADSMYCLNEIPEIANAYGKSYILNHSMVAAAHEKMIFWSVWYIALENFEDYCYTTQPSNEKMPICASQWKLLKELREEVTRLLVSLMDKDSLQSQSISYHAEMSIRRYHSAKETHVEGNAYKNFINRMVFLNDDFNDKLTHFFTAYERFSFNNKGFNDKINTLREFNRCSALYKYENFVDTQL
jgi:hypothetical protein